MIGLVVGAIAKLLMPGKDPGGCIITILLGIAGAFVGTWIGRFFVGGGYIAGWIMSVVGAMILLLLYRLIFRRWPEPFKAVESASHRLGGTRSPKRVAVSFAFSGFYVRMRSS